MASERMTLNQLSYTSHPTITMSDHRPVSAEFELEVRFGLLAQLQTLRFVGWLRPACVARCRMSAKPSLAKNALLF